MLKNNRSRVLLLLLTLIFILSNTGAVFAAQTIDYTTNGNAKQYVAGSVLVLYGKVTDGGKAVPNTSVTVDIKDSSNKVIYYGQLKTNSSGYFKTTFTIPGGVTGAMNVSIKTSAVTSDPVAYALSDAGSFYLIGYIPAGYLAGENVVKISANTEKLGLVFSSNVNYFNNKNNNLDLDSLGVNERNRDCVDLYEMQSSGNYAKISSSLDLVVSDADGGEEIIAGITYLAGVPVGDQKNERKDVLYIVPGKGLAEGTTYKVVVDEDFSANNSATLGEDVTVFFTTRSASSGSSGTTITPEETTVETAGTGASFTDISDHWAKDYIASMVASGIVKGVTATTFAPDQAINRGEFAVLLSRILKLDHAGTGSGFADVGDAAWYHDGVLQAAAAGIVLGEDGKFQPKEMINRQEMAVMLARAYSYAGGNQASGLAVSFRDKDQINVWASDPVAQVVKLNMMSGYPDGTFAPQKNSTRAEAVKTLKIFMDLLDL